MPKATRPCGGINSVTLSGAMQAKVELYVLER